MNALATLADWIWNADDAGARTARAAVTPASWLFAVGVRQRSRRFDTDAARAVSERKHIRPTALPAISVGNLTVGGTGKTPVAAWCARQLRKAGGRPAIVLRGYGDDEWRVHALLNPGLPVVAAPDRLNGILSAKMQGANCVVLDDAFQHRTASRLADIVLMSADEWSGHARMLPAGPFREPLSALSRSTVIVVTVKAAERRQVDWLLSAIEKHAPGVAVAEVRLSLGKLRLAVALPDTTKSSVVRGANRPADGLLDRAPQWLQGRNIVVASAIGNPRAFELQLEKTGVRIQHMRYRDHHHFTVQDALSIARRAEGTDGVVCTLKDAVKLGPLWPRAAAPLWYVSQSIVVERGASALDRALARVLAARTVTASTAG